MNKIFGFILGIIGIIIVFIMLPTMLSSVSDFQTTSYSETESNLATAAGVTTANVTLNLDLFDDDITNVTTISSNNSETGMTAEAYVAATNVLLIGGLDANSTRTLTITYDIDDLESYTGLGEFTRLSPFIIVAFAIFGLMGGFFFMFKRKGGA